LTLAEAAWEVALSPWMGAPMVRDLARRPVPAAPAIWLAGFAATLALTLPVMAGEPRIIKDCPDCPEMVVVPAGEFTMGSPPTEKYRGAEALHRVVIAAPFAVSRFEVTFGQWDACRAAGACGDHRPDDLGWGGADHPVINITWEDAVAYVDWLSKRTGQRYRLLSEAEWEYAARGGTSTAFSFGATLSAEQANFDASSATSLNPKGPNRKRTVRVGSFPANPFGLHDMHGNAWEWTADCWTDEYGAGAPADGSAWLAGDCTGRVLRGGSWEDYVGEVRAAARVASRTDYGTWSDGLRVARDLPASREPR